MHESTFQLLMHVSFFAKVVLLVLAGFSVGSWAIIVYKFEYFRTASRESDIFLTAFHSNLPPIDLVKKAGGMEVSPLAGLFRSVYTAFRPTQKSRIERLIRRHEALEIEKLHTYLAFLATAGSSTPFIGLLGTVWGIINAFRGIGATGSASLAVVAPGIADALITTAAGLAAAIPAVMAYNYFLNWARKLTVQMEDFSEQLQETLTTPEPDESRTVQSARF